MIGLMVVSVLQPIGVEAEELVVPEILEGDVGIQIALPTNGALKIQNESGKVLFQDRYVGRKVWAEINYRLEPGEKILFYLNDKLIAERIVKARSIGITAPVLNEITEDTYVVEGKATPGTIVEWYVNDLRIRTGENYNGRLSLPTTFNRLYVGDKILVRLVNDRGEVSPFAEKIVAAGNSSFDLTLDHYYGDQAEITGSALKDTKLYFERKDGTMIGQVTTSYDTRFSLILPVRLNVGEEIIVTPYSIWGREGTSKILNVRNPRAKLPWLTEEIRVGEENVSFYTDQDTAAYSTIQVRDQLDILLGTGVRVVHLNRKVEMDEVLTLTFFDHWDEKLGETKVKVLSRNEDENPTVESPSIDFVKTITNQTRWASLCTNPYIDGMYRIIALNDQGELLDYRYIDNYKCEMHLNKPLNAGTSFTVQIVDGRDGEVYHEEVIEVVEATKASSPIVQKITDRSTYIEGRVTETEWVEDNIITVNDATNRKLCETHVNFDRTFSCPLKGLLPAGTTVSITQTADGYYPSDPTVATVSRTFNEPTPPIVIVPPSEVKPGAPILHPVTSDALGLTGSGTPGLVVKAWNEFGFRLGEATVNTDGSFRIPLKRKLPQGIGVRVVQLQGRTMSDGAQTYVQEGESVSLKLMDTLTDTSTRLTGHLERMAFTPVRVELRQGKTVLAKDETTFFFRLDFKPQNGPLTLVLIHADGNETTQTIQPLDTTPPTLATMSTLTDRSTRVFGRAEAGSTVVVYHYKKRLTTKTTTAGVYSLNLPKFRIGEVVTVQAMDEAGNTSPILQRTVLGVQAPLTATASSRVVTGKGEPGSLVRVFSNNKMIGKTVKADAKGTYRVSIPTQPKGKRLLVTQQKTGYVKQTQTVIIK